MPSQTRSKLLGSYAIAFSFLAWIAGCGLPAPPDDAASPRVELTAPSPQRLRVAISGDYLPFSDWPASAEAPEGFSVDLARAFARDNGLAIEWVRFRWPALLPDLEADRFDMALSGVTIRADRSVAGRFSLPITISGALVLVPDASPVRRSSDLDRAQIRLAVNAGGHLERVARSLFPKARIEVVPRNQDVLQRLVEGAASGVVTDSLEAPLWQARVEGLRPIGPLSQDWKAALFHANHEALARRFDAWLADLERRGLLARLRERHGLPARRTAAPAMALLAGLDERLALMPDIARAKRALGIPIEDREREERVLEAAWQSVMRTADEAGRWPPAEEAVYALFRAQIEAAKWIQANAMDSRAGSGLAGPEETAAARASARHRLDQVLRPALLRIGTRIAIQIASARPASGAPLDLDETRRVLKRHGLPEAHLRGLHEALVNLLPTGAANASRHPR